MPAPATFIVGISGLSSTGKTTISRLLRSIFPSSFILHQDDFYLPDALIPERDGGLQDWDCVEAIDWARMSSALRRVRDSGALPEDLESLTDASPVGKDLVGDEVVQRMRKKVLEAGLDVKARFAIVDGFLMLHEGSEVEGVMDAKILLRVPCRVV
jgi:nicotinamide/nicotinate riboside kinase